MSPILALLVLFSIALLTVAALNRQIFVLIAQLAFSVSGSAHSAYTLYYLIMFPGIAIHEAAHWILGFLLGLRPSEFNLGMAREGNFVRLGYVRMQRGGFWGDSIVGVAPLLVGSLLVAWIGQQIFSINQILDHFANAGIRHALSTLFTNFFAWDRLLWLYLLFAITNGMIPSSSDRELIIPVVGFVGFTCLLYLLLGIPLAPVAELFNSAFPLLEAITNSFLLIIALNIVVLLLLALLTAILAPQQSRDD